ncbi:Heat-inducible transcription repressor HrcA [Rubellimicrobium mesophilum DSM 19309]|uniref:Heat-inducible transcription repressor HrcA n=1 Tax=Rubellimicrobium mesophilum DSM 19309 TaxID=442562 RepID=A0A017HIK0_9RHOB|nr:heat-inducible transcriptional repressor HrcA [Rubellimicrobium mesophilum]EYD74145.1 Heat-inducible transcription repressor HrcA [Rubellimicrobium mesophilum DSM 19309]
MSNGSLIEEMNDRSREVFRRVVEAYLETGAPVGSRSLTRTLSEQVSAATIRNVMQDLEEMGLLGHPHVSAGRVPTQAGLRLFVDGLLEVGPMAGEDRERLESTVTGPRPGGDVTAALDRVGAALSGLTRGASLVLAPKRDSAPIRHVEFVSLGPDRALLVLVFADGHVENRVFLPPPGQTPSSMREAANFVNALASGRTLSELHAAISREMEHRRQELDALAQAMVESGLATWASEDHGAPERLIVRGAGNLLQSPEAQADLDRVRSLMDDLEQKRDIAQFLELAQGAEGVRIFIGSENKLFSLSGSSLVVSPYMNADRTVVGAIGVIGPTRLNYGRIVPIVDYTAQLVGRLLSERT